MSAAFQSFKVSFLRIYFWIITTSATVKLPSELISPLTVVIGSRMNFLSYSVPVLPLTDICTIIKTDIVNIKAAKSL